MTGISREARCKVRHDTVARSTVARSTVARSTVARTTVARSTVARFGLVLLLATAPASAREVLDLSLAEALHLARAASPRLRELEARRLAGEAEARRAAAARKPDVDLGAAVSRLSDVPELSLTQPDGTERTIFPNLPDNTSARLAVSVPVYTGGRIRSAVEAAGHRLDASDHEVAAGTKDLDLEVTLAYWDLVLAAESRRVLEESIGSFQAHLEDADHRRQFGLAAANEVLSIEVRRDRARLQVLRAERARATAEANLQRLLALPPGTTIVATEPAVAAEADVAVGPPPEPLDELVSRALENRPERAALRSRLAAAEAAVAIERGAKKPQIRAAAGYDLARPNRRILPPADELDDSWDVTLSVAYNLFDGGKRDSAVARSEARVEVARRRLEELERLIRLEVTARRLEIGTARSAIEVSHKAIGAAAENVRVAGERYREGLIPSAELLDAETALLQTGLDLTVAGIELRRAEAGLSRAIGGHDG